MWPVEILGVSHLRWLHVFFQFKFIACLPEYKKIEYGIILMEQIYFIVILVPSKRCAETTTTTTTTKIEKQLKC